MNSNTKAQGMRSRLARRVVAPVLALGVATAGLMATSSPAWAESVECRGGGEYTTSDGYGCQGGTIYIGGRNTGYTWMSDSAIASWSCSGCRPYQMR